MLIEGEMAFIYTQMFIIRNRNQDFCFLLILSCNTFHCSYFQKYLASFRDDCSHTFTKQTTPPPPNPCPSFALGTALSSLHML